MSWFSSLKESVIGLWVKQFLSKDNFTQPSTWKGIIRIAISTGAFTLSEEMQDSLVQLIIQVIATGTMATGVIDALRNEKKLPWSKDDPK